MDRLNNTKLFFKAAALPFLGASIAISAWMIAQLLPSEVINYVWMSIGEAPTMLVLIAAFVLGFAEALFPLCHYLPGTILYAALVVSHSQLIGVSSISAAAALGAALGLSASYAVGRYLSATRILNPYRSLLEIVRIKSTKYGYMLDVMLSIHPNNIAALMVVYGLTRVSAFPHIIIAVATSFISITIASKLLQESAISLAMSPGYMQIIIGFLLFFLGVFLGVRSILGVRSKE